MIPPFVALARNQDIEKMVSSVLDALTLPDLNGKKILLKPNVGRETGPKLAINTNPEVVEAVFNYLHAKFEATFFLGDSPIIMTDTKKAFEQSGYSNLMEHRDIQWLNLDKLDPITLDIPEGTIIKKTRVTGYFNMFDYIVSIPVLKMHMHTGATLSFKNMKGLLYKRDKIKLHHLDAPSLIKKMRTSNPKIKELDVAISDLYRVIKPNLAIIDATFVMEGMGPSAGRRIPANIVIGSTDFLAADLSAIRIAREDWTLKDVPHLALISHIRKENKNKGKKEPQGIEGESQNETNQNFSLTLKSIETKPKDLSPFQLNLEAPPETITIEYPNVELYSKKSCSSCVSTVSLFLKNNKEFIDRNYTPSNPLKLVIGKGNNDVELYGEVILVGNCTVNLRHSGKFIKGCPPVQSTILKTLKKRLKLLDQ